MVGGGVLPALNDLGDLTCHAFDRDDPRFRYNLPLGHDGLYRTQDDESHHEETPNRVSAIVKVEGVCGGEAIFEDPRIAVWHIVGYYYKVGMSVEEILADWDYLTPAQLFSALAYCHDNKSEIDRVREMNGYETWLKRNARAAGLSS